ncbi:MAG: hypothetical protein ACM3Q1_15345 [Bacteroidales bacterium]
MGTPKVRTAVHDRVSSTLEKLERLMGADADMEVDHTVPETVEDAVRRLKGKVPEKQLRQLAE